MDGFTSSVLRWSPFIWTGAAPKPHNLQLRTASYHGVWTASCSAPSELGTQTRAQNSYVFWLQGGYKVSQPKAQLCEVWFCQREQGAWERMGYGPIASCRLPKTPKQLRGFLGITGYCRLWILGYGEIAHPLYQLIKNTQAARTRILVWNAASERAFKNPTEGVPGWPSH